MSDRELRDLERLAAAGDRDAEARLDRALQRAGATAAFEAELEAALGRAQREGERATLHRLEVAHALRDLFARRDGPTWRLALADPSPWPREPIQTFGAVSLAGDEVVVALGRVDPAALARDLPRGVGFDVEALRAVSQAERFEVLRARSAVARAWARADPASVVTEASREAVRHVRARPAMYFGDTHARGLERVLDDALAVALDEVYVGHAHEVTITRHADGAWSVGDDGRPLEQRPPLWTRTDRACRLDPGDSSRGSPSLVAVGVRDTASLSADVGSSRQRAPLLVADRDHPEGQHSPVGGPFRMGLAVVGAVCDRLEVASTGGGRVRRRVVERGLPAGEDVEAAQDGRGVALRLRPDPVVFSPGVAPRLERVVHRAREVAHLFPGLRVTVVDEAQGTASPHHAPGGLGEWLSAVLPRDAIGPIVATGEREDDEHGLVRVAAAVAWAPDPRPSARRMLEEWPAMRRRERWCVGFVNAVFTESDGSHVEGLRRGATAGAERLGLDTGAARWDGGLMGIVSVFAPRVTLELATASRLAAPRVGEFVTSLVSSAVRAWGRDHPDELEVLRREVSRDRRRARR